MPRIIMRRYSSKDHFSISDFLHRKGKLTVALNTLTLRANSGFLGNTSDANSIN